MFISQNGGASNNVYIDNITFDSIPTLAAPNDIVMRDVTHNQATITWDNVGSKYQVVVTTAKLQDPTLQVAVLDTTVETTSVVVDSLDY